MIVFDHLTKMAENGPTESVVQLEKAQPFQYVSGKKVFAVAPMIDWTDHF